MSATDFGPVPISRIKDENSRLFNALQEGRSVSISRHGRVVAIIEPASLERHAYELAEYALPEADNDILELTASEIGQGSPSEFIRNAEAGRMSWVTRNNKVYGVLRAVPSVDDAKLVDAREEALKQFERDHPDATAEEFADAVAQFPGEEIQGSTGLVAEAAEISPALLDALQARAVAFDRTGNEDQAEAMYKKIITRFGDIHDKWISQRVAGSMVELAKLYNREAKHGEAIAILDLAIPRLESDVVNMGEAAVTVNPRATGRQLETSGGGSGGGDHNVEWPRPSR